MDPRKKQIEERVSIVADMLSRGFRDGQVKRRLKAFYGVSTRTAQRDLARARDSLRTALGGTLEDHRATSLDFYRSLLRADSGDVPAAVRVKAQEAIDRLLGLNAPMKVNQEIKGKIAIADLLTNDRVMRIREGNLN